MKITRELLEAMEPEICPHGYVIRLHGYEFTFVEHADPDLWHFKVGNCPEFFYLVTDFEELLPMVFEIGVKAGKQAAQKEMREALGIKE